MFPTSLPFPIPLAYDTLYYVESPDNEPLNQAMRQLAATGQPLFENAEMQPFPFKLLCLTQEELAADRLSARLIGDFDPDLVADTIADLRECLCADTGGTLTARCLPKFDYDGNPNDDHAVCTSTDFGSTHPEEALAAAQSFAREVAENNFERLVGIPYYRFELAKEEAQHPSPRRISPGPGMLGFITVRTDPQEIINKMHKRLSKISRDIEDHTNISSVFEAMDKEFKTLKNLYKRNQVYKLFINDDFNIWIDAQEEMPLKVKFSRGDKPKALYIFYLQQICIAAKNHTKPIYISPEQLEEHQKELFHIYKNIRSRSNCTIRDIESFWDSYSNDFDTALGSIRRFFDQEFDVKAIYSQYHKRYSVELMYSDVYGRYYGIELDAEDIDLGPFKIQ
jgi:hypothetical protein